MLSFQSDPSARLFVDVIGALGSLYDGTFDRLSLNTGFRVGAKFLAAVGYLRNDTDLPGGAFVSNIVRVKANYSFSTSTLVQALIQYNNQSELVSSNIRFAPESARRCEHRDAYTYSEHPLDAGATTADRPTLCGDRGIATTHSAGSRRVGSEENGDPLSAAWGRAAIQP